MMDVSTEVTPVAKLFSWSMNAADLPSDIDNITCGLVVFFVFLFDCCIHNNEENRSPHNIIFYLKNNTLPSKGNTGRSVLPCIRHALKQSQ